MQTIELDNTLLIALGCVCLCGVGIVLMTGFQFISGFLDMFTSIFDVFFDVLSGGPVSWCGCLLAILLCAGLAGGALLLAQGLATCGTPDAINLCSLFGQ